MATHPTGEVDLLVVGGGINGVGIARDAAGRGLATLLVERDDLASATSQWSTKLIHGGLRYLEHYEFRLVAESLAEREVLIAQAPHLIEALSFVLPHEPHLRPAWMIRAGLLLYDRIGGRMSLPRSFSVDLERSRWGAGLKPKFRKGFVYADARVDDARLVVLTAVAARERGAEVRTRTRFTGAVRERGAWRATLRDAAGTREVRAKAIVNVAGPWVAEVLDTVPHLPTGASVRHVKGSHIVVPRVHEEAHAYILQNADKRIVFVIPWQDRYTLIGTTDVPVDDYEKPAISPQETDYLLELANAYLAKPLSRADVVWSFSGVRPLYDDGKSDPSSITRDYVLKTDAGEGGRDAPVLSIYGGKLTTYRKLAEAALQALRPWFPAMKPAWTQGDTLPGGDLPQRDRDAWVAELARRYPRLPEDVVRGIGRRHGTRALEVLGDAKTASDLGADYGAGLTEREVDHFVRNEWAASAEDVLWRRTKCGLRMDERQRAAVAARMGA
ncbi:MAG: glycerol-3-phosphate dehydrogenase [Betaproteobacteria bacterium]|jgi:glycerol-3-phosphate dehydrogenase|nr:glycerol-3-phosphate dehydrogenase [Betaproteobacteria bacterium]